MENGIAPADMTSWKTAAKRNGLHAGSLKVLGQPPAPASVAKKQKAPIPHEEQKHTVIVAQTPGSCLRDFRSDFTFVKRRSTSPAIVENPYSTVTR